VLKRIHAAIEMTDFPRLSRLSAHFGRLLASWREEAGRFIVNSRDQEVVLESLSGPDKHS
jgi:hypothetical protein